MYDVCQDVLMQFTDFLVYGGVAAVTSAAEKLKVIEALAGNVLIPSDCISIVNYGRSFIISFEIYFMFYL